MWRKATLRWTPSWSRARKKRHVALHRRGCATSLRAHWEVFDVSGAGDTVIATLGLMVAAGAARHHRSHACGQHGGRCGGWETKVRRRFRAKNCWRCCSTSPKRISGNPHGPLSSPAQPIHRSNIVKALNERGETDIVAVDNLTRADKFKNLVDCEIAEYVDKKDFLEVVESVSWAATSTRCCIRACSDTMKPMAAT